MKALDKLDKRELRELLNKCWMTHDGIWFYHCLQEFGIETTNKLNKAAISSLAPIEMKRIKKAVGIEDIQTLEQLKEILEAAIEIVTGDFMNFNFSYPSENVVHWEFEAQKCWAYVGIKNMGVIDQYQCGVLYRIGCWLDSLGIEYSISPQVRGCLMHTDGNCSGDITITDERLKGETK